ncbi:MAG: hypothetical protein GC154_21140 [bacterium]|nr:hypothetical protein [bacterium]
MMKRTLLIAILALGLAPLASHAQFYGGGGFGGGGFGYGGGGFGGGGFGYGGGFGGEQGPGVVTVKYGEKVYDAVFGDLVDYKVYYIQVPADTVGVHYFDDGTNGDEVAYDGMPSYIIINRDSYLGPFSIKYKKWLSKAVEKAEDMGALDFYNLGVVTDDPESKVTQLSDWRQSLQNHLLDVRATLAQFEGYDDTKYIKAVDPTLLESQEGFGGVGAGIGPGGILPDLPPPPGLPKPGDRLNPDEGGAAPPPADSGQPQESGRFDPIGRAQQAVQVQEAANQLP